MLPLCIYKWLLRYFRSQTKDTPSQELSIGRLWASLRQRLVYGSRAFHFFNCTASKRHIWSVLGVFTSKMPPALRIRPYKDFLTPLLHRRFARATSYIALLCYAESIYIGGIHSCKIPGSASSEMKILMIALKGSGHGSHSVELVYDLHWYSFLRSWYLFFGSVSCMLVTGRQTPHGIPPEHFQPSTSYRHWRGTYFRLFYLVKSLCGAQQRNLIWDVWNTCQKPSVLLWMRNLYIWHAICSF